MRCCSSCRICHVLLWSKKKQFIKNTSTICTSFFFWKYFSSHQLHGSLRNGDIMTRFHLHYLNLDHFMHLKIVPFSCLQIVNIMATRYSRTLCMEYSRNRDSYSFIMIYLFYILCNILFWLYKKIQKTTSNIRESL